MKKLLYLLLLSTLLISCSSDDPTPDDIPNNGGDGDKKQTSFSVFTQKPNHYYCKAYCYNSKGESKVYDIPLIGPQLGADIIVDSSLDKMYITYKNIDLNIYLRIDTIFQIKKDQKNIFSIKSSTHESIIE